MTKVFIDLHVHSVMVSQKLPKTENNIQTISFLTPHQANKHLRIKTAKLKLGMKTPFNGKFDDLFYSKYWF